MIHLDSMSRAIKIRKPNDENQNRTKRTMDERAEFKWGGDDPLWIDSLFRRLEISVGLHVRRGAGPKLLSATAHEDLVQNVLLAFWRYLSKFEFRSEAQMFALVKKMSMQAIRSAGNKTSRDILALCRQSGMGRDSSMGAFEYAGSDRTPSSIVAAGEEEARLYVAMALLPLEDQQILHLRRFLDTPWTAIAEKLGLATPDAARMKSRRAEERLTKLMFDLERKMIDKVLDDLDTDS